MKPTLIILLLLPLFSHAQKWTRDTFQYANGNIEEIRLNKWENDLGSKKSYITTYDSLTGLKTSQGKYKRYKCNTGT